MNEIKRLQNERKFSAWTTLPDGGRRYELVVPGRHGWKAMYVKEVDQGDSTTSFRQEIYDDMGTLVEVHQKFPIDTGHQKRE